MQIQSEIGSAVLKSYVPANLNKAKTHHVTGWQCARYGTGRLKFVLFRDKEKIKEFVATQTPGEEWTQASISAKPEEFGDATHWGVEYEASGRFDIAVDEIRVWAE